MAGAATTWFTQKRSQYQEIVNQAQGAQQKLSTTSAALDILAKPQISQSEAESLIMLYQQSE